MPKHRLAHRRLARGIDGGPIFKQDLDIDDRFAILLHFWYASLMATHFALPRTAASIQLYHDLLQ
jgi:hypothetical protein